MGAGGIETTWSHDWPFAAWFSLLLIVGLLGWTMFAYRRDRARLSHKQGNLLLLVRMMTLAGILAAAWGWQEIRYETDLPDLIILADVSQSMNEADGLSGSRRIESWKRGFKKKGIENPTRLDITKSLLGERSHWLAQIKRRYQLRYFGTGEMLSRHRVSLEQSDSEIANIQATANASRLGQGIKDAVHAARGVPTVGIVLFTDGAVTSGPSLMEAAEYARQNNLPLYLVGLGSREVGRDAGPRG